MKNLPITAPWIWIPEWRTLPNTFLFFRYRFEMNETPLPGASGWVSADSRYLLYLNGRRISRGPAPSDPRWWDVDPVFLDGHLLKGSNVIAALVHHYGIGDGTYIPAPPGFVFQASIPTGSSNLIIKTGPGWKVERAGCYKTVTPRRGFLRAFHELYDARFFPDGWNRIDYDDSAWIDAATTGSTPGKPTVSAKFIPPATRDILALAPRSIPPLDETQQVPARRIDEALIKWNRSPDEFFEHFTPKAWIPIDRMESRDSDVYRVLTYDLGKEHAGYATMKFRAPEGTPVFVIFGEMRDPAQALLPMACDFAPWVKIITREGLTEYQCFEWESLRFIQFIHPADAGLDVLEAGMTLRLYPFEREPDLATDDEAVNAVLEGAKLCVRNLFQETIVDNAVRERQQYTADVGHNKRTAYFGYNETRLPARMIRTWSQGQNPEGWFPDSWPGWDRMERLWETHLGICPWAPLVDHAISFCDEVETYLRFTGDFDLVSEIYPRLRKFVNWLIVQKKQDGLLPVEGYNWCSVWIDHDGWRAQRDKVACLNIYAAGVLKTSMFRLAQWLGDNDYARDYLNVVREMEERVLHDYWSDDESAYVDNLPHLQEDGGPRLHDRTISMALLYEMVPKEHIHRLVERLARPGPEMGISFPGNAQWRYWALAEHGRADAIIEDIRTRWATMPSLLENGTLSEPWVTRTCNEIWCQNATVPMYVLYGEILGIEPLEPGWKTFRIRPQLGGLKYISATISTPKGDFEITLREENGRIRVKISTINELQPYLSVWSSNPLPQVDEGCLGKSIRLTKRRWLSYPLHTPGPNGWSILI